MLWQTTKHKVGDTEAQVKFGGVKKQNVPLFISIFKMSWAKRFSLNLKVNGQFPHKTWNWKKVLHMVLTP